MTSNRYARSEVIDSITVPSTIPKRGINNMFFALIIETSFINRRVPKNANTKANIVFIIKLAEAKKTSEIKIPNRVESIVAAVEGETNRFRLIVCIISPDKLSPIPVKINARSLGIRL